MRPDDWICLGIVIRDWGLHDRLVCYTLGQSVGMRSRSVKVDDFVCVVRDACVPITIRLPDGL